MGKSKVLTLPFAAILILSFGQLAFSQAPVPTMSAREFWQEFEKDRQKAEDRYIGQTMNYTGVVLDTGTSIYLTPNVMLSDAPNGPTYLICVLPRADSNMLAGFKKGDKVTMSGRVYRSKAGDGVVAACCSGWRVLMTGPGA